MAAAHEPMPFDEYMANIEYRNTNLSESIWAEVIEGSAEIRLAAMATASTYEDFLRLNQPERCYVGLYALHWQLYRHYADMAFAPDEDSLDAALSATREDNELIAAMLDVVDCSGEDEAPQAEQ